MRTDIHEMRKYVGGKRVLIIGGAPRKYNKLEYDIIVRINNYERLGITRTDIHYSHYGKSILVDSDILLEDGVKYCYCKYPNADFVEHTCGEVREGISGKFGWVYQYRKNWFKIPYYIPSLKNFKENFSLINRIPTTGLSAVLDIQKLEPAELHITGFDNFSTHIHHGKPWKPGDGNHDPEAEKMVMKRLEKEGMFIWHK